jgi:serine/threonine-protein kinase RsbW
VFEFTNEFTRIHAVSEKVRYVLDLAVEELFTNMVKYNQSGKGDIHMHLASDGKEVLVRITDPDSDPFDVSKQRSVDLKRSLEERKPGGLGIYLVQKLVENLQYEHQDRTSIISFHLPLE